jgi:hypothetical protein
MATELLLDEPGTAATTLSTITLIGVTQRIDIRVNAKSSSPQGGVSLQRGPAAEVSIIPKE